MNSTVQVLHLLKSCILSFLCRTFAVSEPAGLLPPFCTPVATAPNFSYRCVLACMSCRHCRCWLAATTSFPQMPETHDRAAVQLWASNAHRKSLSETSNSISTLLRKRFLACLLLSVIDKSDPDYCNASTRLLNGETSNTFGLFLLYRQISSMHLDLHVGKNCVSHSLLP